MIAARMSSGSFASEAMNACAVPWNDACTLNGMFNSFWRAFDGLRRFAQRRAGREVEGNGHRRKLSLMIDRERRGAGFKMRERAQRHRAAGGGGT
jgi:hypothetical protein